MKNTLQSSWTILVLALLTVAGLTYLGCNNSSVDSSNVDNHENMDSHEGHDHESEEITSTTDPESSDSELDKTIDAALKSIEESKTNGGGMPAGILELVQLSREHPDNERLNYHLGLLSMESGQYEKAVKRFEKIVSLQPDREDYQKLLEEAKGKL